MMGGFGRGGGMGGGFGGRGGPGGAGSENLPFAGIPPELLGRVEELTRDEPDCSALTVPFSHLPPEGRSFSLWRFLAPYKFRMLGALVLVATTELLLLVGPYLVKVAIDKAIIPHDFSVLLEVALAWIGTLTVAMVISGIRIRYVGRLGELLMYALRVRVFSHMQRLSLEFYTGEKAGRLLTRMTSDIEALSQLLHDGLINLASQLLSLVFILVMLFSFNVKLTLFMLLVAAPVMFLSTAWFRNASERGYEAVRNRIAELLADLQESLSGMRLVISFNRMKHNIVAHRNIVGDYRNANNYTAWVSALYQSGTTFVEVATTLAVLVFGFFILVRVNPGLDPAGAFTVGALIAFSQLVARFFRPINQLTALYNQFQSGSAAVVKLRDLLDRRPSVPEKPGAVAIDNMQGDLLLDGVSFSYDEGVKVLDDISLHVPAGKVLALVGPTGAGKSTLAKLIARFYDPDSGTVRIDGNDLRDVSLASLHTQLAVVPQEPFLFHGSIKENVRFSRPQATDAEILAACRAVGIDELIARLPFGLETPCHERGASLSSGERQLLALARAFLAQPRVLILDEATSNMDQQSESKIQAALDVLLEGRTAIIVAHRLATAMRADVIAVVDHGGITELGSHDELIARNGYYADMFRTWSHHQSAQSEPVPAG